MGKIDTQEVGNLRNIIKSNIGMVLGEYKTKSSRLDSKMSSVIRTYSEYGDVTSKAREIQGILRSIHSSAINAEKQYTQIVDGLKGVVNLVKGEERESKSLIKKGSQHIQGAKLKDKLGRTASLTGVGLAMKGLEGLKDETRPIIRNEEDARKYVESLEEKEQRRLSDIKMYTTLLNEARQSGQGQPQWLLDKLEELGAPFGNIEETITIDGKVMPRTTQIGDLTNQQVNEAIATLLEDMGITVEANGEKTVFDLSNMDLKDEAKLQEAIAMYASYKGEKYEKIYNLLKDVNAEDANKMVLYWLTTEKLGKNVEDVSLPSWWKEKQAQVLKDHEVTEENYKVRQEELYDYYNAYIYTDDVLKAKDGQVANQYQTWFEQHYGHLNASANTTQRIKYLLEKAGVVQGLKDENGCYTNGEDQRYIGARDLFLYLYGQEDKYYDGVFDRRNDKSFIIDKIQKVMKGEIKPLTDTRDFQVEEKIISGQYGPLEQHIYSIDADEVKVVGDTVYLKKNFDYYKDVMEAVPQTVEYSFKIKTIDYMGRKFVDKQALQQELNKYTQLKSEKGYYQSQYVNVGMDPAYSGQITQIQQALQQAFPDQVITQKQAIEILSRQIEANKVIGARRETVADEVYDATQEVLDGIAIIATVAGGPVGATVAVTAQLTNIGISAYREKYGDAAIRSAFLIGDVVGMKNVASSKVKNEIVGNQLKYSSDLREGVLDDQAWEQLQRWARENNVNLKDLTWNQKKVQSNYFKSKLRFDESAREYVDEGMNQLLELSDIRLEELQKLGYSERDYYAVLAQSKEQRSAEQYLKTLQKTDIEGQWAKEFMEESDVVVSYMSLDDYTRFVEGGGKIGRDGVNGGQFVLPQKVADGIEKELSSVGSISSSCTGEFKQQLAIKLGLPQDALQSGVVRVEVPIAGDGVNLHIATGVEEGCNYQWIPGTKTIGGTREGVINQITKVDNPDLFKEITSNVKKSK